MKSPKALVQDRPGRIVCIQDQNVPGWYWIAIHPDGSYASGKADSEAQCQKEALSFLDTADTSIIINYVKTF